MATLTRSRARAPLATGPASHHVRSTHANANREPIFGLALRDSEGRFLTLDLAESEMQAALDFWLRTVLTPDSISWLDRLEIGKLSLPAILRAYADFIEAAESHSA